MEFIDRDIKIAVDEMLTWFPIISITGPRQSGKSTLIRHMFKDYEYVNLENSQTRLQATLDPVGFINNRPNRLIIDEAQLVPDLFSQIQVKSDEYNKTGQYVISGSQNFLLLKSIKQSLAGRVGLLKLLPLSYAELYKADPSITPEETMFKGGYPRIYKSGISTSSYYESYIDTYLLRDIVGLINESNSKTFKKFIRICAQYAGNLVNMSNLSRQTEIARQTAVSWLNLLDTSYIAFTLQPYFNNTLKSLTKAPKLYFYDTGLLVYSLGIKTLEQLLTSPHLGKVYENFIIAETIKSYRNNNTEPELYYYRDSNKTEVDLVDVTSLSDVKLIEIKSGETYQSQFCRNPDKVEHILQMPHLTKQVVMRIPDSFQAKDTRIISTKDYLLQQH